MKECTGKEITEEWLYHLGVPTEQIEELAEHSAVCVPTMMPYITAFFMPRTKGDRPDVIPDGCVNFAFLGQFAETPRDTVFHDRILRPVPQWKPYTDCSASTVAYRKYGEASTT